MTWTGASLICVLYAATTQAQPTIQWGLTLTNINNPITPIVVTNGDGSITITAGGGDTYDSPDSFTYAYQQVTGDFDVCVQVRSLVATDPAVQDSPKGALMARANLNSNSPDIQINVLPLAPSGRDGELESVGRFLPDQGGQDFRGTGDKYGGDTLNPGACTYPNLWLRIQRQGDRFITYYSNTNKIQGTNGWNILCTIPAGPNFPPTMFVGLSTVAHNLDLNSPNRVAVNYANYGNTPNPPSIPTSGGVAVPAANRPGTFPKTSVVGVNWNVSLPDNGLGYPGDIAQSSQGPATNIIWNSGGFASVSRDVIVSIDSQSPSGFSAARYQCGALDFLLSVPFNADNLIGGRIRGTNGATIRGAGTFTLSRLSTGRYALTIPGKTGSDGMLLLQNSGYLASQPAVVDTSFMSYEYGGTNVPSNAFIIEARYIEPTGGPGGLGQALLRDTDFNFVYVDFQNPLAPPGTLRPVLTISRSGSNVIVSWTNGPGFILQQTGALSANPMWSNLGTQNPQSIALTSSYAFFRVVSPVSP